MYKMYFDLTFGNYGICQNCDATNSKNLRGTVEPLRLVYLRMKQQ